MGAKATTIEEQIALLQGRGMQLDESQARQVLLDIGYYRLGFYSYPFEVHPGDGTHRYRAGTDMESVLGLYHFDFCLRTLLHESLLKMELNFRTKVIYEASNTYREAPCWFADERYVRRDYAEPFERKTYTRIKNKQEVIRRHHEKHRGQRYAPAWKTLEFFTFGAMILLYEKMIDTELKRKISRYYAINHIGEFVSFLKALRDLRNACAHGQVLFDFRAAVRGRLGCIPTTSDEHGGVLHLRRLVEILSFFLRHIHPPLGDKLEEQVASLFRDQSPLTLEILRDCTGYRQL